MFYTLKMLFIYLQKKWSDVAALLCSINFIYWVIAVEMDSNMINSFYILVYSLLNIWRNYVGYYIFVRNLSQFWIRHGFCVCLSWWEKIPSSEFSWLMFDKTWPVQRWKNISCQWGVRGSFPAPFYATPCLENMTLDRLTQIWSLKKLTTSRN